VQLAVNAVVDGYVFVCWANTVTFANATAVPPAVVSKTLGPFNPQGDLESSLDVQYIGAVGRGNTNWFITEATWLYSFVVQFNAIPSPPSVVSMSYCWYEGDQCEWDKTNCTNSYAYVERLNVEFQKIGVRGVTVRRMFCPV
jgi:hypothetical protein